jgi:hypothetical protein
MWENESEVNKGYFAMSACIQEYVQKYEEKLDTA